MRLRSTFRPAERLLAPDLTHSMTLRIQLVSNPHSGTYSPRLITRLQQALEAQGATVTLGESSPHVPFTIDPQADRLCVVGGDGTLRHVTAAILASGRDLPLIAYPGGTVNLMQRELHNPTGLVRFAQLAVADSARGEHFAATLNNSIFLACASVGPDSEAVAILSERLKRWIGRAAYALAFFIVLLRWPRHSLNLCIDGENSRCEAFYVAKGRYFAGPWSFAPDGRMDQANLHLVVFEQLSRWLFLRFALAMLLHRSPTGIRGIHTRRCNSLTATSTAGAQVAVQADGDIAAQLPVHISLNPTAFSVIRPRPD